jgi:hypothetical protein
MAVAWANGFRLTPDLLHKWRVWRFLPGPQPGGPTGKGRGKGEVWPVGAMWRVAWMSRWRGHTLSYDALRLAIWPWTRAFESERVADLRASVERFLRQDEKIHRLAYGILSGVDEVNTIEQYQEGDENRIYIDLLLYGVTDRRSLAKLVKSVLPNASAADVRRELPFLAKVEFSPMQESLSEVSGELLTQFISAFRTHRIEMERIQGGDFWNNPLDLARLVIRELYRVVLTARGELPSTIESTSEVAAT